jgi:hypothetical protein
MSKPMASLLAKLAVLPVEIPMPAPKPVEHALPETATAFIRERRGFVPEDMIAACFAAMLELDEPIFWQFNSSLTALVRRH